MNNYFLKIAAAAITLAAAGYGAYKLYQKYCGAKIAKQNKFRNRFEDMSYNFEDDDDEYLEDDDVYYFGSSADYEETEKKPEIEVEITVPEETDESDETETATDEPAQEQQPVSSLDDATLDDVLGSTAE